VRLVLVAIATRRRPVALRAAQQGEAIRDTEIAGDLAWTRRLPAPATAVLGAATLALLLSGFDSAPLVGVYVFLGLSVLFLLWAVVLPRLGLWRRWTGFVSLMPPLIRVVVYALIAPRLATWYFDLAPGASTAANQATGSFGAQIIMMGVLILLVIALFPLLGRNRGDTTRERAGRPIPVPPFLNRRAGRTATGMAACAASFFALNAPSPAHAACLDPSCCFGPNWGAAAVTAAVVVLTVLDPVLSVVDVAVGGADVLGSSEALAGGGSLIGRGLRAGWDGMARLFSSASDETAASDAATQNLTRTAADDATVPPTGADGPPPDDGLPPGGQRSPRGPDERPETTTIVNARGDPYPSVKDMRTGEQVRFPPRVIRRVPSDERVPWTRGDEFSKRWYKRLWRQRGLPKPDGGWDDKEIHHILPREFGGSNDWDNLTPLTHDDHVLFTNWWNNFEPPLIDEIGENLPG